MAEIVSGEAFVQFDQYRVEVRQRCAMSARVNNMLFHDALNATGQPNAAA